MTIPADAPAASTEALDAAAAAAAAPPAPAGSSLPAGAPAPSPDPTSPSSGGSGEGAPTVQDFVDDEGLDLDSADLPATTKEEIRKLRREVRGVKDVARTWTAATQGWAEGDIAQLRQALELGPTNPDVIGEWMLESARGLLGERFDTLVAPTPAGPVPEVGDPDGEGGTLTQADVDRLVTEKLNAALSEREQRSAMEAQVRAVVDQSTALGFGPTHWAHKTLLFTARDETNGDLAAAAELLKERNVSPDTATADDSQPGAGGQPQPGAGHTPAATAGGTPAGTQRPKSARAAAEERIQAVIGNARGFNAPL